MKTTTLELMSVNKITGEVTAYYSWPTGYEILVSLAALADARKGDGV